MKKIAFIIPPTVELLDLAGPVQVFTEAKFYGFDIATEFYLYKNNPISTSGLGFGNIAHFTEARLTEGDFVFIPGMDQAYLRSLAFRKEKKFFGWLRECTAKKITVCSVCNGVFALGEAGLLNDIQCTTHWRRVKELQLRFPKAIVLADVLYVKNRSRNVCTSAGISAGIDLALSILEDLTSSHFTHKVARGLVVFYRGNGISKQLNNYLAFRNHINGMIHNVQDYLVNNLTGETSVAKLALIAGMSPRNLTRVFKETTGTTINEYLTQLRFDTAKALLKNPKTTMAEIALQCGFKTVRQLQRIMKTC